MYSSSFNAYQGFPGYGKSRGKGIKGRPTLAYEPGPRLVLDLGEGANQWKDERIRQVPATMIALCGFDCIAKACS
ncbi:unnamed protein product [Symbiodinium necroappetens]|uniref:Uncharacterized protein n=1 Tax=Symbiodinium necroappetens TaxID=1628268 RepID=A0A812JPK3_9DINO|nr:unnamed protein product [Symbiodinium necroappetens]